MKKSANRWRESTVKVPQKLEENIVCYKLVGFKKSTWMKITLEWCSGRGCVSYYTIMILHGENLLKL